MLRLLSLMRWAISRRTPMTLISSRSPRASWAGDGASAAAAPAEYAVMSSRRIRPSGPLPWMRVRSIPASCARRRLAGDVITRPDPEDVATRGSGEDGSARPAPLPRAAGTGSAAGVGAAAWADDAAGSPVSSTISSEPTATLSPGPPWVDTTVPLTGEGTSTAAFSVMTSTSTCSSATVSPGLTCQPTISADTVPSPRSGSLKT
jgi:hypothetical protein